MYHTAYDRQRHLADMASRIASAMVPVCQMTTGGVSEDDLDLIAAAALDLARRIMKGSEQ